MKSYKQKPRRGVLARFKITGTGKVLRRAQNMRHLRRKKSKSAIRASRKPIEVKGRFAKKIKQMMGIA
ncbi:MAG: bL35 family ribosomal protein [Patescibacteria group bacterium]